MWTNKQLQDALRELRPQRDELRHQHRRCRPPSPAPTQNRFLIDGLKWLGSAAPRRAPRSPPDPISPTAWYTLVNKGSGKCVDARAAATANGTAIQQYTCNGTTAQQFQFQPTTGGFTRVNNRDNDAPQAVDVTDVSTADNAPLQLWTYGGGNNQQWQPVAEGGGYYHFVSRHSGKCLDVPPASTADSVQLVQRTCNGTGRAVVPARRPSLTRATGVRRRPAGAGRHGTPRAADGPPPGRPRATSPSARRRWP